MSSRPTKFFMVIIQFTNTINLFFFPDQFIKKHIKHLSLFTDFAGCKSAETRAIIHVIWKETSLMLSRPALIFSNKLEKRIGRGRLQLLFAASDIKSAMVHKLGSFNP